MGLDWMLHGSRPKAGCEEQFRRINKKLNALEADESLTEEEKKPLRRDLEAALEQVAVTPFQVIGAPRVGIDADATEWFRTQLFAPMQKRVAEEKLRPAPDATKPQWHDRNDALIAHWSRPFEVVLEEHRGKYVVELAKDQEGVAAITGMLCSSLDFRGKAVALAEAIPEELRNEAHDDHDAQACVDYADRLEAALEDVDDEHLDELIDTRAAVKWLRYWGSRGFGYSGWY